jgi:2-oxo-3-hexenedioate decarboxylase
MFACGFVQQHHKQTTNKELVMDRIAAITADLLRAYDQATLLDPPAQVDPQFDLNAGYAVGAALTVERKARGERPIGRKLGFTNAKIWAEYGVNAPFWAYIYDTTLRYAPNGMAMLELSGRVAPRIEPELVLGLGAVPDRHTNSPEALLRAVAWVALGLEVVDCHFAEWRFTLADAIADFGLHAALLVGPQLPIDPAQPEATLEALAHCRIVLQCNGAVIDTGVGANALGSPITALGHLVRTLEEQGEAPLQAGEVITTGTLTPAFPIVSGETWTVDGTGLPLAPLTLALR